MMYMADVSAFFLSGRFNWIRKMFPERSVIMSLIILISQETVEKLEWAALLWILMLAKARSGPSRTGIADIRSDLGQASNAGQRQNQRNPGGREAEGQLAASLARYSPLRGCASLAPCHLPFCLYARPIPFFQKSPKLPLQLVWMLARLDSRLNRWTPIAALLVRKILGTPE